MLITIGQIHILSIAEVDSREITRLAMKTTYFVKIPKRVIKMQYC